MIKKLKIQKVSRDWSKGTRNKILGEHILAWDDFKSLIPTFGRSTLWS